ncbi:hypothetical protein [Nonomuraea sp. 10N515B]
MNTSTSTGANKRRNARLRVVITTRVALVARHQARTVATSVALSKTN